MKNRERRLEGVNGEPIKISSGIAVVPINPPKPQNSQDTLEPTSDWMPSGITKEHSGRLTTAENQEVERNTPKPKSEALNFNQTEARAQTQITQVNR